jgi:hypothetical protein
MTPAETTGYTLDYEKILSHTIQDIKPSGIRKFFDLLNNMSDVTALTVGEPDFVTPWHIRTAGIESLEKGKTYAQLYPSRAGGCELFLVHISAKEQEKSRALVPFLEDGGYFCCFEGREEALFFERLLEGYGLGEGSVFYDRHSGNYLFYVGKGHGQPLFLEEFAKPAGHWTYSYLLEHFERIERI